jgi:hypothetical protein
MSNLQRLADEVRALSPEDRRTIADIAMEVCEEDEVDDPLTEILWEAEKQRLIKDIAEGRMKPVPGDQLIAKLRRQYR